MKKKLLIGFAVVTALVFSGMLGKGDFLGIETVFGYRYGGGGGGGTIVYTPAITVQTPVSGASYNHGSVVGIGWTGINGAFTKYKVYYSTDNGSNWTTISDNVTGTALSWTVPNASTTQGKIKVEGYDGNGVLLAAGLSGGFTILGTMPAPTPSQETPATPPPAIDPNVSGTYDPASAKSNNPNIGTDKGLAAPASNVTVYCTAGDLIKGSLPSVYYCGADGKRYVFVNDKAFFTWYADFSTVKTIADSVLSQIPLGGNITYRPGVKMIKIISDPRVYAVARGGILRWVSSEAIAKQLYGDNWNQLIDDVPDSFFVNYTIGSQL